MGFDTSAARVQRNVLSTSYGLRVEAFGFGVQTLGLGVRGLQSGFPESVLAAMEGWGLGGMFVQGLRAEG